MHIDYETLDTCILCGSSDIRKSNDKLKLSKCSRCGLLFDNPRPTTRSIEQFYSAQGKYEYQLSLEGQRYDIWETLLGRIRKYAPDGKLLDIGAGTGDFLSYARKYYEVFGTEISSEAVVVAQKKYGIDLRHGEVEQFDFKDESFDAITMSQVLEHLPYPGTTISTCFRLLKKGGVMYIGVPNEDWCSLRRIIPGILSAFRIGKFVQFSMSGLRKIDFVSMKEIHLSHFSDKALRTALNQKGFEVLKSGIDFMDFYMYHHGLIQIPRHALYYLSQAIMKLTGANVYNCLWIAARKP